MITKINNITTNLNNNSSLTQETKCLLIWDKLNTEETEWFESGNCSTFYNSVLKPINESFGIGKPKGIMATVLPTEHLMTKIGVLEAFTHALSQEDLITVVEKMYKHSNLLLVPVDRTGTTLLNYIVQGTSLEIKPFLKKPIQSKNWKEFFSENNFYMFDKDLNKIVNIPEIVSKLYEKKDELVDTKYGRISIQYVFNMLKKELPASVVAKLQNRYVLEPTSVKNTLDKLSSLLQIYPISAQPSPIKPIIKIGGIRKSKKCKRKSKKCRK